ncbi:MAG: ATP-dependent zinc metalloprotease FtsH [Armatimonadetes bacterium]|nr:ATP-dependent zinc metalloprotease FtsH [Armatimonadota bacterium]MBS1700542.1 ATP-dependent zinc metalloprotease FtsH [Armatimonadota bacterium]MBS1728973.1 ATP-dependent zinc metalloprotease FtsH [Armatimonadota bacterium]
MGFKTHIAELKPYELMQKVDSGAVLDATWQQNEITGKLATTGEDYKCTYLEVTNPNARELLDKLNNAHIPLNVVGPGASSAIVNIIGVFAPTLIIVAILWFFFIRAAQASGSQAMNFGKSKARRVGESGPKVTFDDVAGIDEAKQELFEVVDFLKNTKKYAALGAKIPKGILLTGPPGVGKTHLARAIAGEAGVPFFHISGSDFVEMFVGVGAARVRDLFETAKAHRPSLIFVDEIDAVGRQRGAGLGGGHDEREQTLNQLLVEMDGFDPNSGVILIAATNRPDVLDPALLRPGRFDRQIVVDAPDQKGRFEILKIHSKGKPLEGEVNLETLSKRTPGFTGADLANTLNEGALLAARRNRSKIGMIDLEEALDRVIAGPQRKSRIMNGEEREVIAYHEAGHALIGELLEHSDPVHKVTVLPRGMSLGSTWSLPEADKYLVSKEELIDDITTLLGGRVAEETAFGRVWTGASGDLQRVTAIARAMITKYGMSEKLGTLAIGRSKENPFLGRDYYEERDYSEDIAKQIDEEVRAIVDRCYQRAVDIVNTHRKQLDEIVKALLERETLDRDEFLAVMEGRELPPIKPVPETSGAVEPVKDSEVGSGQSLKPPRLEPGPA